MRNSRFTFLTLITALVLALAMGSHFAVEAQKGGKGGGHGNGRGNGGGKAWGNPHIGGQPGGPGPKFERPQPQGGWRSQRPAPQVYQPQIYRPQVYQPRIVVQQPRYEMRQQKHAWKQERKQQRIETRIWPQQAAPQRRHGPPAWAGVWTAPGQVRKEERRIAKQERKEQKAWEKFWKKERKTERMAARYVRGYDQPVWTSLPRVYQPEVDVERQRYYGSEYYRPRTEYYPESYRVEGYSGPHTQYYPPVYYPTAPVYGGVYYPETDYGYYDEDYGGTNWTELLLGTVLNALLGGELGGDEFYAEPAFGNLLGGLIPDGRDYYALNRPYGGYYGPQYRYGYGTNGYYSPYEALTTSNGVFGPILFGYPSGPYTDSFIDDALRRAFNAGYEQGFLAGQAARYNGYGEAAYNDPYFFDDAGYGYGAYSIDLNRQRRLLSEGYERGYQDALNRNYDYDAENGGDVDLVSLMLSSVLGMFNV